MLAVPLHAELAARARRRAAACFLILAIAVGLYAAAGRLDDLNLGPRDAVLLVAVVFAVAILYSLLPPRTSQKLEQIRPLDHAADRAPPERGRASWLWVIVGGLAVGGVALVLDFELDVLGVALAVGLGGVAGEDAVEALLVRRYERQHGRTVYRVEDPPGTEAGLAWLPRGGQ